MSETIKNPERELLALAALNDADIDTDAIPEVRDWSHAIPGRFCRLINQQVTVLLNAEPDLYQQGDNTQPISNGTEEEAGEFVRRFRPVITGTIRRMIPRSDKAAAALVDDLVQETFLKLFMSKSRRWEEFLAVQEPSAYAFIKVLARNITIDHFRGTAARRQSGAVTYESGISGTRISGDCNETTDRLALLEPMGHSLQSGSSGAAPPDRSALLEEIDRFLKSRVDDKDRTVFWLYYRNGYTAREISGLPALGLTVKAVEYVLFRIIRLVRSELTLRRGT